MLKKLFNFIFPGKDPMSDYQFYHHNLNPEYDPDRHTFALFIDFNKDDLYKAFCTGEELTLQLGVSTVHPKDNFCKEIGRSVAIGNSKARQFKIDRCDFEDERIVWTLYSHSDMIMIKLRTSKRSFKPHLLKARSDK